MSNNQNDQKTKADLLKELASLGVHPTSGRKVRADKGKTHNYSSLPRADKGKKREKYSQTSPAYLKKVFFDLLRKNTPEELGEGDQLVRDANMIFPPNVTHYYKTVTVRERMTIDKRTGNSVQRPAYTYKSSQPKKSHPEELRWRWYFAEYRNNPEEWLQRICDWYFIYPHDIDMWTYPEWAYSYVSQINGHPNRKPYEQQILSYDEFAAGKYGKISYTSKGEIIWPK